MQTRLGLVSAYSFLYGVRMPEELLDKAQAHGATVVSICDIDGLYGVHSFLEASKERNIRPVIGAALSVPRSRFSSGCVYTFVESRSGFGRLCEILTERNSQRALWAKFPENKDNENGNFDPLPLLRENSAGLVLASAGGEVLRSLAGHSRRLYAAISPLDLKAVPAARSLSLPLAFIDNSLFLEPGDFAVHRVLRAIGLLKTIGNLAPGDTAEEGRILRPPGELSRFFASWPEAARGSAAIAESCRFDTLFNGFIFPSYGEDPGAELRRRTFRGAAWRYGELGDCTIERIEYELGIIEKMGFSPYFLRMDDIVKMANNIANGVTNNGSGDSGSASGASRTCGRGSGAASIVSYSLGITNVEPIRHNLYFERFLNPARSDPPDIDVDFAWDERDSLIKMVIDHFGAEYCARVANHNFFRPRSALRETAKAYGFSDGAAPTKEILGIAKKIEGLPRGLGMHCGGLVITPAPVRFFCPVEKSAKAQGEDQGFAHGKDQGFPLLAWEKEGAEAAGFVKIDLLGNRSLAVIRDAVNSIREQARCSNIGIPGSDKNITGTDKNITDSDKNSTGGDKNITGTDIEESLGRAVDDSETVKALARGDSMGVFYIESPAMRQLQKKTGAGDFDHIVIHSSIIRPAANKFIAEYVRRLKGGKWTPLHPRLERILGETYGILCYQEDVSKTAVALAGFNEADADRLRKVIAKKAGGAKLKAYESQFFEGCRKNGVGEETIHGVWAMMLSFDGYSFCKPHSASYAMVSFQSAYLRVHHPAVFMAAVLSNQGGYYRPGAYISECRRMGLSIAGPDINLSRWKYYGKGRELVVGLMAIKGLSFSGAEKIIAERERAGDYRNLDDFSHRVKPARDDIIALCPAGVFDSIADALPRPMQARRLLSAIGGEKNEKVKDKNYELFENPRPQLSIPHSPHPASLPPGPCSLWEEYRALGYLRNHHPLVLWKKEINETKNDKNRPSVFLLRASQMADHVGRYVKMLGWPVTQKEVWTKDGLTMSFLSLEDETGIYETVIFPKVYDKYNKLLFDQQPLWVCGQVCSDEGAVSLEVREVRPVSGAAPASASLHNAMKPVECFRYEKDIAYRNSVHGGSAHW